MKWLYPEGSVCSITGCGRPPRALGRCDKCHAAWRWRVSEQEYRAFKAWWMRSRPVKTKKDKRAYNTAYVRAIRARKRAEAASLNPREVSA